ncbi:unnamed protein product [Camellia sinensis]
MQMAVGKRALQAEKEMMRGRTKLRFGTDVALKQRESQQGVLVGHVEGITFLDNRGDGRYFISNSKDQTIKLWDIRKMSANATGKPGFGHYEWDC